ncbi:MAG: 3-phosphoshikimate 1-carboxyvinyltransferase [Gemmatimonadales bacterium]
MPSTDLIAVPGDKSITHRALMLAALARGTSRISQPLTSLDARSTARVLRQLGAEIGALRAEGAVLVKGRGRFREPASTLHCGNSGTTARLMLGLLAPHRFRSRLTGDGSLRRRPMRRLTEPLGIMGARFEPALADRLPLVIRGGGLQGIRWELPVSSAQLKSGLLLAGIVGDLPVAVREPHGKSRDHTERMLRGLGFRVRERSGWVSIDGGGPIAPFEIAIPGDPSSAAFLVGAGLLGSRQVRIGPVGLNPTRTAFLDVLARMGAAVSAEPTGTELGEPVGTIDVGPGTLKATVVPATEIPALIDEIPLLAVMAARAEGTTRFEEVGELRVKESDRLALMAENLTRLGYRALGEGNTLIVEGSDHPPRGRVRTDGDHRIAMAFAVLGTVPGARVAVDDPECAAVSFPGFATALRQVRSQR